MDNFPYYPVSKVGAALVLHYHVPNCVDVPTGAAWARDDPRIGVVPEVCSQGFSVG